MRKRVETERKTADTSSTPRVRLRRRPNKVPFGGAAPRKWHRPRAHQRAYHSKGWRAEEEEQLAAEVATVALPPRAFQPRVAAPARASTSSRLLGGAGLGGPGYALIPGAPLATRESRACQAERQGVGRCRPRRRLCASNLAALSAALSATLSARGLSAQLSAQLSAGFGGAGFRGGLLGRGLSGGNGRRRPRVTRQWLP